MYLLLTFIYALEGIIGTPLVLVLVVSIVWNEVFWIFNLGRGILSCNFHSKKQLILQILLMLLNSGLDNVNRISDTNCFNFLFKNILKKSVTHSDCKCVRCHEPIMWASWHPSLGTCNVMSFLSYCFSYVRISFQCL